MGTTTLAGTAGGYEADGSARRGTNGPGTGAHRHVHHRPDPVPVARDVTMALMDERAYPRLHDAAFAVLEAQQGRALVVGTGAGGMARRADAPARIARG